MIPTPRLVYKLRQRLNKIVSNAHQDIPEEDIILVLRESLIKLIKKKLGTDNIYRIGFDGFKKRYQDLQFLVENFEDHPIKLVKSDGQLNRYTVDISKIQPKFMFYVGSYVLGSKGQCKDKILYANTDLIKHGDITTLISSPIYKPSFEWREVLVDISTNELGYYTDGTFDIDTVHLSYLRYPKEMDIAGYIDLEGKESKDVDCELDEYLEDELLDIAELSLAMSTNNVSSAQNAERRLQDNE